VLYWVKSGYSSCFYSRSVLLVYVRTFIDSITGWSTETDLVFAPDSGKLMLMLQRPLVHVVIQDSFDILCVLLSFNNAFSKGSLIIRFVKDALYRSALKHSPGAATIYQRLHHDKVYIGHIIPLVSHVTFITTSAEAIHRHMLGFILSVKRSRRSAVPLLYQRWWQLATQWKSRRLLRNNCGITPTHAQLH